MNLVSASLPASNRDLKPETSLSRKNFTPGFWNGVIVLLIAVSALSNAEIFEAISDIHYVIYLVPLILIGMWFLYPQCRNTERKGDAKFVWLMLAAFIVPALLSPTYAYRYIVFMTWGMLPFAFPVRMPKSAILSLFLVLCFCQIGLSLATGFTYKGFDVGSLSSGSAAVTHTLPGIFGLMLGVLARMKRLKLVILCIAIIFIAGKRGVLLSSAVGFGLMMVSDRLFALSKAEKDRRVQWIIILPITVIAFLIFLNLPDIYQWAANRFSLNVNIMTSGRYDGQALAYRSLHKADWFHLLLGQGLGTVDQYAIAGFQGDTNVIHNDFLRLLIDLGICGALVYVFCFMKLAGRGTLGLYILAYAECSWLTENSLINVMFFIVISMFNATNIVPEPKKRRDVRVESR